MLDTELDKKETHEGDVVELMVDLPEYNLKRGQRGVVITEFEEPEPACDIEFEDEEGDFLGFAYSVKPNQITNVSRETFEQGMALLAEGDLVEAERRLQQAVDFNPRYKGAILNFILKTFTDDVKNWEAAIFCLRLLLRLDPEYQHARDNLAITYLNYGVQKANEGNVQDAIRLFSAAVGLDAAPGIVSLIKENFAAAFTTLGVEEHQSGNYEKAVELMRTACVCFPDERTRHNLGIAYAHLAHFYMRNANYQEAIAVFQSAEETGLLVPELLNDYGVALVFEGRLDEATFAFERALTLAPGDSTIKENWARLIKRATKESFVIQDIKPEFVYIPAAAQSFQQAA